MQIIPAVDVLGGQVVRLRQGRFDDVTTFGTDPVAVARSWMDEGAELVHVVDLNGARHGEPDRDLWTSLATAGVVCQIGGGIRTVVTARTALDSGAARVVLGTAAVWNPEILGRLVEAYGPERVVAAVDARGGLATGSGWEGEGRPVGEVCGDLALAGVEWILATGIERDGMMTGPDTDLLTEVRRAAPAVKLIASGGVASLANITALAESGYEAAITGRALYEGRFSLKQATFAAAVRR